MCEERLISGLMNQNGFFYSSLVMQSLLGTFWRPSQHQPVEPCMTWHGMACDVSSGPRQALASIHHSIYEYLTLLKHRSVTCDLVRALICVSSILTNPVQLIFLHACIRQTRMEYTRLVSISSMPLTWYAGLGSAADQPGTMRARRQAKCMTCPSSAHVVLGLRLRIHPPARFQ